MTSDGTKRGAGGSSAPSPTDVDPATAMLRGIVIDHFGRIRESVHQLTDGLSPARATWRPDPDANSMAWLLWHAARVQDDHVAHLARSEQAWTADGFYDKMGLPFPVAAHGYGHTAADVAAVRVPAALLDEYQAAVHARCLLFARSLTAGDLARIVDTKWNPPVTAAVRLVSLLGDCLQHLGQAAYVRGLAERAGID